MTSLLVATTRALLRHDTDSNQTYVMESDAPLYYGVSWFPGDDRLFLSHSGGAENLSSIDAYLRSEVGFISIAGRCQSPQFLSNPHQIRCLEPPYIAATNTGRNALVIINTEDWSTRQIRFDDVHWDRFDPAGQGSHFNSIDFDGSKLFVLAHNFDAGSYELQIDWPGLDNVVRRELPGRQLHNLWYRDRDTHISCDSPNGALIELNSGRALWQASERNVYSRGLASNGRQIFVGATEIAPRGERQSRASRVIVLDAESYRMEHTIDLGVFGEVTEIRLADEFDLCHPVGALRNAHELAQRLPDEVALRLTPRPGTARTHQRRNELQDIIAQRDLAQDEAREALAQLERVIGERAAMIVERDAAISARDEAIVQQDRMYGELLARIAERDQATAIGDEALMQQSRLQGELRDRIAERDRAIAVGDEAMMQQTRLQRELLDRVAERDKAIAVRDEAMAQKARLQGELLDRVAERDTAVGERDELLNQNARLNGELVTRIDERDRAMAERDENLSQAPRLEMELATRVEEPDRTAVERDGAVVLQPKRKRAADTR